MNNTEERYTIKQLIESEKDWLGAYDQQRRYLCREWSATPPCPNCGLKQSMFDAYGIDTATAKYSALDTSKPATCSKCGRGLLYALPFTGGWYWQLVPAA